MRLRPFALAFFALICIPAIALALATQRAQIGIDIIIDVTPNPLGYHAGTTVADASARPKVVDVRFREVKAPLSRTYEAQSLQFTPGGSNEIVVAQSVPQKSVEVMASVSPNPNATLLVSNVPDVVETPEAGVKSTASCAYTVTVNTAVTNWQLKYGLATNFTGSAGSFPGGDVAQNAYVASPAPTTTAFPVYATNGGIWSIVNNTTYSGTKTFCVDLTFNIPIATPQGTYSSNAIYTLYY